MKISVQLHNELHYKLGLGVLTIYNLIDMGISERNAHIIKNILHTLAKDMEETSVCFTVSLRAPFMQW